MDALFLELLNRSLAASWLILAVLILRPLTKKAPKNLRCLLWGLAALRLLLPARLKSPWSLIPSAAPLTVAVGAAPAVQSGIPAVDAAVNPALASSLAPTPAASADPAQIWLHIGAVVWLVGMAALLCYTLVSFFLLRRRVADAVLFHDNIYLTDRIDSPFVLGVVFPRIYLPFGLTEENMALVLAHEQGHITRHDHWWKPLGFALLCVNWFHPLSWLAYVLFCKDIELACDEHVLSLLGPGARKPYSRALLDCSVERRRIAACPLAFGESDAKRRIGNVLRWKKPTRWAILAGLLLCVVLAVCFLTDPMDKAEAAAPSPEPLAEAAPSPAGTPSESTRMVTQLVVGRAYPVADLFGQPDEKYSGIRVTHDSDFKIFPYTDEEGRLMLRAQQPSDEPFELIGEYYLDSDTAVTQIPMLFQTVRGTMLTENGGGPDGDALERTLDIRYYEFSLDEFTLHVGEEPVELYAYNRKGERVMASWMASSDAVSLTGGSAEDGGITVVPRTPMPGGVIVTAMTDDGLGGSVKIYLPPVEDGGAATASGADPTPPPAATGGLELRYFEKPLDEFTLRLGDDPVELYAVDLYTGERVSAEWSISDESALALELRDYDICAVIPKAAVPDGVTLTAAYDGRTVSVRVHVLP